MLQIPNPTERHPLENLASFIEQSKTFDMSDRAQCVIGHARQIGLIKKKNGHTAVHARECACADCCDWRNASKKLGISIDQMHKIFSMQTTVRGQKSAVRYLRKLIPA